ncbi:Male sterility protein [Nesidiocoris tenuis]|uniref:Fatty acyl-CoA reductase n=1 Tax=Nesidiocoris tenuis TaxID=355587 RepID=A0ABN7AXW8_9HEMI|nr:Male sterility protein [Nesidiocoris tenuis]
MERTNVRDYYDGKSILITGGTGFMGKVLLEKLLRSCPGIKNIYIMCRSKRAKCPTTRIQEMTKLPLFEKLLKENPDAFDKVIPITGDLTKNNLGMRFDSRDEVIDGVHVVFNLGASLRLEADLKDHVATNLSGTKRVLEFAQKMKKLESFVHVSTVFCQCEPSVVEEKIFPTKVSPHAVIDLADWIGDKENHKEITDKLLGEHPNCYTFTKQQAEMLVSEYKDILPISIVRPAIVTPTHHDPFPGWVDSLNGPIGILVAGGKGVMRSMVCGRDNKAQMIPCDVAINAIILAAWKRAVEKDIREVPVYNVSSGDEVPLTYGQLMDKGKQLIVQYPVNPGLWYPGGTITTSKRVHDIKVFFLQILPALFIDLLLFVFGQKTFMMRVQNKIRVGCEVLEYFTTRSWNVEISNTLRLHDYLNKEEQEIFFLANIDVNMEDELKNAILGTKMYCLKEPLDTIPSARRLLWIYWIVDKLFISFVFYQLAKLLFNAYHFLLDFDTSAQDLLAQPLN